MPEDNSGILPTKINVLLIIFNMIQVFDWDNNYQINI